MADKDTRIVEMQFDNRKFERNIAKSQKSLEDFKKELDFDETSKGLTKFTSGLNNIRFDNDNLEKNVEKLTQKFTGLGDAGEFVVSRIRHEIEGLALQFENFVKSFTTMQIRVGQSKYDSLNKAVQTIVAGGKYTEEQAYGVFERVMEYTDQTSASFQDMVNAISNFTAVGQGLGESEKALEGIFNMTSKAGKGVSEASVAMSVFSKAMGAGFLGYENWTSLNQSAHIVTEDFRKSILDAAVAVGDLTLENGKYYTKTANGMKKVEVTADNLENTLNKRWLTKNSMMALFDKYYFAKLTGASEEELSTFAGVAYQSAQKALTFADAMGAIKEAVSSGWLKSFRIVLGSVSEAMEFFTNLCERVIDGLSGIAESRNKVLEAWAGAGGRDSIISLILGDYGKDVEDGAYGLLDLFQRIGDMISNGFWSMAKIFASGGEKLLFDEPGYREAWLGVKLQQITENVRDFIQGIKDFFNEEIELGGRVTTRLDMIQNIVNGILSVLVIGAQVIVGIIHFVSGLRRKLQPSIDAITNVFSVFGKMLYKTAEDNQKNGGIISFFDMLLNSVTPLTDAINYLITTIADVTIRFIRWGQESGFFKLMLEGIGKAINYVAKIVSGVGGPLIHFFGDFFQIVQELFENGFSKEALKKVGPKIRAALKQMFQSFVDLIPDSMSGIRDAIKDLLGLWADDVDRSDSIFTKIREKLGEGFNGIFGFLKGLFTGFKDFNFHDLLTLNGIFGVAYRALNEVAGWFKGLNLYGVIMAFLGVASLFTLWRLLSNAKKAVVGVKDFFENLSDTLSNGIRLRSENYGEYVYQLAKGIILIVAAITILGTMNLGALTQGVVALGIVMAAVYFFQKKLIASYKDVSWKDELSIAASLVSLAVFIGVVALAVSMISIAVLPLTSMGWGATARAFLMVIDILGAIGIFTVLMIKAIQHFAGKTKDGKTSTKEMLKIAGMMLVISASVAIISAGLSVLFIALTPLAMTGWDGMARALIAFVAILGLIGGFLLIMTKVLMKWSGGSVTQLLKFSGIMSMLAKSVGAMAVGIGILAVALLPLALMSWSGWARALAGLAVILLELTGFIKLIQMMSTTDKSISVKIKGLAALAAGIGLLVLALIPLAIISWEGLARMAAGLTFVLLEIVGLVKIIQMMDTANKGLTVKIAGLAMLAFSIGILVLALVPLALMSWEALGRALVGFTVIILELVGLMELIKVMFKGDAKASVKIAGIIGLAIGLVGLALAVSILGNMDTPKLVAGVVALGAIMLGLVGFIGALSGITVKATQAVLVIGLMLGLVVTALLISFALNEVRNIPWEVITAFTVGLAVLMIGIAGAIKILDGVKLGSGIKSIILVGVAVAAIVGVLALMVPLLVGSIGSALVDVSGKLELAAGLIQSFATKMGGINDGQMDNALAVLGKMLGMLSVIAKYSSGFATANKFYSAMFSFSAALDLFIRTSNDLGDPEQSNAFKLIDKLKNVSTDISTFNFDDFLSKMLSLSAGLMVFDIVSADIQDPTASGALAMIQSLAGSASNIETLSKLDMSGLVTNLGALGGAMFLYAKGAKEVTGVEFEDLPEVTKAAGFLQQVIDSLVGEDGEFVFPDLPSQTESTNFGNDLAQIALAMDGFINATQGWTGETDKAVGLLTFLGTDLKNNLTPENLGVTRAFTNSGVDQSVLGQFGNDLAELAAAMKSFISASQGAGGQDVKDAEDMLTFFSGLKTKLDNDTIKTVVTGLFTGVTESSLKTFADNIGQLGFAVHEFASQVNFDDNGSRKIQDALDALSIIAELQNRLPKMGGLIQAIAGEQNLGTFATNLTALGQGIGGLIITTRDIVTYGGHEWDTSAIDDTMRILQSIADFYITTEKLISDLYVLDRDARKGMDPQYDFNDSYSQQFIDFLSNFGTNVAVLFKSLKASMWGANGTSMIEDAVEIFSFIKTAMDEVSAVFGTTDADFKRVESFIWAMNALISMMNTWVTSNMYAEVETTLQGYDGEWFTMGTMIPTGIANGMLDIDADGKISDAAFTLGQIAKNSFMEGIEAESPSRLFARLAQYIPQGVAVGINKGSGLVATAIDLMVKGMTGEYTEEVNTFGNFIKSTLYAALDEVDSDLTITPVIDLTNINDGVRQMNRIFGNGSSPVIDTANASRWASYNIPSVHNGAAVNQNGTDLSAVTSRLDRLDSTMAAVGNKIKDMKIILDTNVIAGGVSDKIDTYIGTKAFYEKRRG